MGAGVNFGANQKGSPKWAAEPLERDKLEPYPAKIDASQFKDGLGITVKTTASALAAATSITVAAISKPLTKGTVLDFGGGKFARLSADAAAGAVTIAVDALPTALANGDIAVFSKFGRKFIASGTLVGRTYAERDAGTAFGPATDTDDIIRLVAFDVPNTNDWNDIELVKPQTSVKENYLPDWAAISASAPLLAKLRAIYDCIEGTN